MTQEEILSLALSKSIKANEKMLHKKAYDVGCHDLYHSCCDMVEHISYHAVKGKFPEKIFCKRSPNQTESEAQYIKDNYKQHTLPVFVDYISTITRPFGDGNWSINYREDEEAFKIADQTFQNYVEGGLPIYGSLENFIKFILPSIKSIDANGYLGIRPKEIEYTENNEGQPVIDSDKLYEPTVYYYESKSVIDYEDNQYYLFLSKEKSLVMFGGKEQLSGTVFELYTEEAVFFIKQIGVKGDNRFEIVEFYRHDLRYCFVHQLMGIPNLMGDKIVWQSPFLYSVDLLDIVTMNANWLQASINKCVYPHVVMFGSPCEFKDSNGNMCIDGSIYIDGASHHSCPSCNGQGLKSRLSPLGTLLLSPSTKFEVGDEKSTQDPLRFISPEVHTLEFIRDKIEQDTAKARLILHLQTSNSTTKGTENLTATGMAIDNKAMYAFVKPISDQIFTLFEFCLNGIGLQRYGEAFVAPELTYPKTFDFKSPEDYLQDITNAITNNLPPSFIQTVLMQYIQSYYGDNDKTTNVFKIVIAADRLFGLSSDEINMQLARGTISKWEQVLHTSILSFINDSIMRDANFLDKEKEAQILILQDLAKMKSLEISNVPAITGITLPTTEE